MNKGLELIGGSLVFSKMQGSSIALGLILLCSGLLASSSVPEPLPRLEANPLMRSETRWVVQCIEQVHLSKKDLDQRDMGAFIESYLEALDFHHLYFTRAEVDLYLKRFAPPMVRYLRAGNLSPAFEMFEDFRERVRERLEQTKMFLAEDISFAEEDFYETNRIEADWPSGDESMEVLWRQRLQAEVLNELLALLTDKYGETLDGVNPLGASQYPELLNQAKADVEKRYERWVEMISGYEAGDVQEIFLGELAREFDPHSSFLSSDQLEDFAISMENALVGIGAVLESDEGICRIRELVPGGPADLGGVLGPGDEILAVGEGIDGEFEDVVNMRLRKIVKRIRGSEGTLVRLLIRPAGSDVATRREVKIIRDRVKLTANLAYAEVYTLDHGLIAAEGTIQSVSDPAPVEPTKVGVIYLPSFYGRVGGGEANSADDVASLIQRLKEEEVSGIVLDLRRNGGGLLSEAIRLTGLFIPDGPVVQVKDTLGEVRSHDDLDGTLAWDGPLIVLVSRYSASASEIVAGALQVHGRAIVVGDSTTHGKGTVQTIFEMSTPIFAVPGGARAGAAKVTIQKFYLPDGASTQNLGVQSDIVIPSFNEFLPIGESDIANALLWDEIDPREWQSDWGSYEESLKIGGDLRQFLSERSGYRKETLPEFSTLVETIEFLREQRDQSRVSLNLERRIARRLDWLQTKKTLSDVWDDLSGLEFKARMIYLSDPPKEDEKSEAGEEGTLSTTLAPRLDVALRESIRVMLDWIQWRDLGPPGLDQANHQHALLQTVDSAEGMR
ncbi:MAG: carboxy terminal-processing peptidase [Puniceicoccaceae bacterium]